MTACPKGQKPGRMSDDRFEDPPYLDWIRGKRCAGCGCWGPCEPHHLLRGTKKGRGWGLKAGDDEVLPLGGPFKCGCHAFVHGGDETTRLRKLGIDDAPALAGGYRLEYLEERR